MKEDETVGIFQHDHVFRVMVYDNQDHKAKEQFVSINCKAMKIPLGRQTDVPGAYLSNLESKGHYMPVTDVDPDTGMERSVRSQWMPRFGISVISDLTAGAELKAPPVPSGGILLEPAKLTPDVLESKSLIELRTLCAERGLRYAAKAGKEDLIELLSR